ncbi:hypothetical protein CONLIGDRAFT_568140 [Coniochaeta ligniaria NRRL 30616]|uniref:Uncharacterized protein n=1 Tax=Coniochaeta ligniaria NRRL 30616 TaxID=1408157 RepID=A0A1J7K477_9PEZI|nr:hypothetical protein CONLIGDRAFT_568140 [Coniochaeta ligniaria NRRL 30616]
MGGSAFTSAPYLLNTPRMPPAVYHQVKSACQARLRELYLCVASPIEGPAKGDHGDVDIVVALERQAFFPSGSDPQLPHPRTGTEPFKMIAAALGAEHVIYLEPHLVGANMAIPWPGEDADMDGSDKDTDTPRQRRHIQVDIHIAQSLAEFQWHLFRHAHGDFFQLVGTTVRSLGLTVDEQALWIRIPEIEARDRKRAKVFLTDDPVEVLEFLGYKGYRETEPRNEDKHGFGQSLGIGDDDTGDPLSHGIWERPFNSVADLFDYVATCRWFWVTPPEAEEETNKSLRSNDRRRMKQRRVYQQWIEEYIPALWPSVRDDTFSNREFNNLSPADKRVAVREAAFERWPAAREIYMGNSRAWYLQITVEQQQREILAFIREAVAALGQSLNWNGVAVSALKKTVLFGDPNFGVVPGVLLRYPDGRYDVDEAKRFVMKMCWLVGEEAWSIMCAKGKERLLATVMQERMDNGAIENATASPAKVEVDVERVDEERETGEPKTRKAQVLEKIKFTAEVTPDAGEPNAKSTQSRLKRIKFGGEETP